MPHVEGRADLVEKEGEEKMKDTIDIINKHEMEILRVDSCNIGGKAGAIAERAARYALDKVHTDQNGMTAWISVGNKKITGRDPETNQDAICGTCFCATLSVKQGNWRDWLAVMELFAAKMEELCGRQVFFSDMRCDYSRMSLSIDFRIAEDSK